MRILLDESVPRKLKKDFGPGHDVQTVRDKGWLGQKNGALLKLIVDNGFDLFITVDRNLPYQQNLKQLPLPIIVLCAPNNRKETLAKLIPKLLDKLSQSGLHGIIEIS